MASSLVAADGVVVAQVENDSESFALGLDARTGTNRWKLDRPARRQLDLARAPPG